jgi:hypothetical protein
MTWFPTQPATSAITHDPGKPDQPTNAVLLGPLAVPVSTACELIGVRRTRMYELIASGKIDARKSGARTVVLVDSLRRYVANLPTLVEAERDARAHVVAARSAHKR